MGDSLASTVIVTYLDRSIVSEECVEVDGVDDVVASLNIPMDERRGILWSSYLGDSLVSTVTNIPQAPGH